MSSMSGSEDEEEKANSNELIKKRSSKKSEEYDMKSSKMANSENARSRRSMFKRSNATDLSKPKKSTFANPNVEQDEDDDNEAIKAMGDDDSDGSFFDDDDK